mmetsp:Transcript_54539/g.100945  ORF Transcript_54539/g.100945 Transcript_54539/m.100945 type:complete len:454 (+) Transcript_54539:190-1551(+)
MQGPIDFEKPHRRDRGDRDRDVDEDRRDRREGGPGRERGDPARHERGGRRARNDGGWKDLRGGRGGGGGIDYHQPGRPGEEENNQVILDGGHLLSLLKANPPSSKKYTREELLSIKHLSASKVKPPKLNPMIDRENFASPLVLKGKFDLEEDGAAASRRENYHNKDRRPQHEPAILEDNGRRAPRKPEGLNGTMVAGGSVASAAAPSALQNGTGRGGGRGRETQGWGPADHAAADARLPRPNRQPNKLDMPEWDMPDPNAKITMNLSDYTLGDIHQVDGGLGGGFFVDEDDEEEDVTQASRGFGKWFGRPAAAPNAQQEAPLEPAAGMLGLPPVGSSEPSAPTTPSVFIPATTAQSSAPSTQAAPAMAPVSAQVGLGTPGLGLLSEVSEKMPSQPAENWLQPSEHLSLAEPLQHVQDDWKLPLGTGSTLGLADDRGCAGATQANEEESGCSQS